MRMLMLSFAATIGLTTWASANDGFLGLPAGGLTLQQSADIAMLEEDLYLSTAEIRVSYLFRNESRTPIAAQIGFPLPGLPVAVNFNGDTGYDIQDVKNIEILKFETRIEGQVVKSRPIIRAFVFKKDTPWEKQDRFRFIDAIDITSELTAAGIPLSFDARAIKFGFARLPASKQADWIRRGLYAKSAGFEQAEWWLSTIFVREQNFPPGAIVRVSHKYQPHPSGFVMVPNHLAHDKQLVQDACVDASTGRAIQRALSPNGGSGSVIDYVLTTANTWKGPIGKFRMTIDKGKPANIVSFCGDNVKKIGPTTFSIEARNFKPARDVKVLIVQPPQY